MRIKTFLIDLLIGSEEVARKTGVVPVGMDFHIGITTDGTEHKLFGTIQQKRHRKGQLLCSRVKQPGEIDHCMHTLFNHILVHQTGIKTIVLIAQMNFHLFLDSTQITDSHRYDGTVEPNAVHRNSLVIDVAEVTGDFQIGIVNHHIIDAPVKFLCSNIARNIQVLRHDVQIMCHPFLSLLIIVIKGNGEERAVQSLLARPLGRHLFNGIAPQSLPFVNQISDQQGRNQQ